MSNNNKMREKREYPPVLTIFESIVMTICLFAAIYLFYNSFSEDIARGYVESFSSKLLNADFMTALGLMVLVCIYVCIRIVNYFIYIRPLKKARSNRDSAAGADGGAFDAQPDIGAVRSELSEIVTAVERLLELSVDHDEYFSDMRERAASVSAGAKRMYESAAEIENDAVEVFGSVEAHLNVTYEELRRISGGSPVGGQADATANGKADATADSQAETNAGGQADESEAAPVYATEAAPVYATEAAPAYATEAAPMYAAVDGQVGSHAGGQIESPVNIPDNISGQIYESQARIIEKLKNCSDVIGENIARSNRLTLSTAIESAKIGEAGRGFAYVADDIRESSENLHTVTPIIGEAVDGVGELVAMAVELAQANNDLIRKWENAAASAVAAASASAPTSASASASAYGSASDPALESAGLRIDADEWQNTCREILKRMDSLRAAIRSHSAALTEESKHAGSDLKRIDIMMGDNAEIIEKINVLQNQIQNIENKLAN